MTSLAITRAALARHALGYNGSSDPELSMRTLLGDLMHLARIAAFSWDSIAGAAGNDVERDLAVDEGRLPKTLGVANKALLSTGGRPGTLAIETGEYLGKIA